jgi:HPt (histidine-containing phosphotransfer) domain-containing protein
MLIDSSVLEELSSAMGRAQVASLVKLYLKHTRGVLRTFDLTNSLATSEDHRRAVHGLRGGSLQLGTDELVELCARLEEDLSATGRLLTAEEVARLRATLEETHAALNHWLASL